MEWYYYILTAAVGIFVGFVNVMAGGGSILSLSLLMFLGLPANIANGTNRIAILMQDIVGVGSYRQQKVFSIRQGLWFAIPAIVGAIIGAQLAVGLNEKMLEKIIGGLLVILFFIVLQKPKQWLSGNELLNQKKRWWQIPVFFLIGIYGGFIQMGTGFFLLSALVLGSGYNLIKANAFKVLIVLCYTPFALAIFFKNHQVDIEMGITLAAGTMLGAFLGSRVAVKKGAKFVRFILLIVILIAAFKFLGIYDLLRGLITPL